MPSTLPGILTSLTIKSKSGFCSNTVRAASALSDFATEYPRDCEHRSRRLSHIVIVVNDQHTFVVSHRFLLFKNFAASHRFKW